MIPNGNPAWTRSSDFTTYGGDPNKQNYQSQGVTNPRTDVGAEGFSRLVADMAAVVRTASFAALQALCNDSAPAAPTVETCRIMTGIAFGGYPGAAPPTGFPTFARNGNGDVTITFSTSYNDEYGIAGSLILTSPVASLIGTTGGVAIPQRTSANVLRVRCFDLNGVAISNARFSLTVGSGT